MLEPDLLFAGCAFAAVEVRLRDPFDAETVPRQRWTGHPLVVSDHDRLYTARAMIHARLIARIGISVAIPCLSCLLGGETSPTNPGNANGIDPNQPSTQVLIIAAPTARQLKSVPDVERDPIAADSDLSLPAPGTDPTGWNRIIDSATKRVETWATTASPLPTHVAAWFTKHPDLRRMFWLSFSPSYDDPTQALAVLEHLLDTRGAAVNSTPYLAIAMALVHDQPDAVLTSRYYVVWGVTVNQFQDPPTIDKAWDWLTDPAVTSKLKTPLTSLPVASLVHMVDIDVSADDHDFVLHRRSGYRNTLAELYASVLYDQGKLAGETPWLGSKPYSLRTIEASGGVCVEQAYYASRVAKCLGTPALIVRGRSRASVGRGHAWLAFLNRDKHSTSCMAYGGRYDNGRYYVGELFDPQTRTCITDRQLELTWASALRDPDASVRASALVRLAETVRATKPALAATLAREAVFLDDRCGPGWLAIAHSIADGSISLADANRLLEGMLKALEDYPDITAQSISIAVAAIPAAQGDRRQHLYDAAYAIYKDRPDLRLTIRLQQATDLDTAGKFDESVAVLGKVFGEHGSEGALILPAAEWLVSTALSHRNDKPEMNLRPVRQALEKADAAFPKIYNNKPSDAYAAYRSIIDRLK